MNSRTTTTNHPCRCRCRCRLVPWLRMTVLGLTLVVAIQTFWIIPSSTSIDDRKEDGGVSPSMRSMAPLNSEMTPMMRRTTKTNTHNATNSDGETTTTTTTVTMAYRHPNFKVNFPVCLVHVGKAAGSSVSCGLGLMYADCEGMPRDKLNHTYFFHMRRNHCGDARQETTTTNATMTTTTTTTTPIQTYLVTLRNPLTRLQSWFDFEKDIIPTRGGGNAQARAQVRNQRGMLFQECYPTFEQFVLDGLKPLRVVLANDTTTTTTTVEVTATNSKEMSCQQRAWAAALGVRAFSYHEWYNYEYYWTGMQPKKGGFPSGTSPINTTTSRVDELLLSPVVYALRTEHLQQDWKTVSKEPLFRPVNRRKTPTSSSSANTTTAIQDATATTTNTSPTFLRGNSRAREQLCLALCPEIQFYKRFLGISANLSPAQRLESLEEVQDYCPLETSLEIRDCPGIPSYPKMKVPRRQYRTEIKKRVYEIG